MVVNVCVAVFDFDVNFFCVLPNANEGASTVLVFPAFQRLYMHTEYQVCKYVARYASTCLPCLPAALYVTGVCARSTVYTYRTIAALSISIYGLRSRL